MTKQEMSQAALYRATQIRSVSRTTRRISLISVHSTQRHYLAQFMPGLANKPKGGTAGNLWFSYETCVKQLVATRAGGEND